MTVEAPAIARRIRPGQFVILRVNETGERLPLTVAYSDALNGPITIVFKVVGKSTALLASLPVGAARLAAADIHRCLGEGAEDWPAGGHAA